MDFTERVPTREGIVSSVQTHPRHSLATAADLESLERHEVVGGELVEKAAPSFEHGDTQGAVYATLFGFRGRGGDGRPGGWWLGTEVEIELDAHEVYLPDIAGWRIERMPERPRGRPVRMAPDWVCEVLSPSTTGRDLGHKQRTYHRSRVGYYWVVDPVEHVLSVYRWQEDGYLLALVASAGERVRAEPFDTVEIDIAYLFDVT